MVQVRLNNGTITHHASFIEAWNYCIGQGIANVYKISWYDNRWVLKMPDDMWQPWVEDKLQTLGGDEYIMHRHEQSFWIHESTKRMVSLIKENIHNFQDDAALDRFVDTECILEVLTQDQFIAKFTHIQDG